MTKHFYNTLLFLLFASICSAQVIPTENLQLWLRADSVEITGGFVSRWYDLSSNNYSIIQSTAANRPLKIESALNNLPVIKFDGINDYLDGGDILDFGTNSQIVFLVYKASKGAMFAKTRYAVLPARYTLYFEAGVLKYFYFDNIDRTINISSFNTTNYSLVTLINHRSLNKNQAFVNSIFVSEKSINGAYDVSNSYNFLIGAINNNTGGVPPQPGFYSDISIAELIIYNTELTSSEIHGIETYLMNKYSPPLSIGEDINISYGFCDTTLVIDKSFTDILWSTGETNDTIYVNKSGEYTVQAKDIFGRIKYDTINVQFPNPNIDNSFICLGDSVLYNLDLIGSYSYLWSDLSTEVSKYYKDAGEYWVRIEDDFGCFDSVFFSVEVDNFKNQISLGNDTSLCAGNTIQLLAGEELCTSFLWSLGGSAESFQTVNETGWQKIVVENENGCTASDSIYVTIVGIAPTPGYIVENLCFGDTTQFMDDSTSPEDISSWKWIINENDTLYTQNAEWIFETTGTQNVELIVESESGCANNLNFTIEILPIPDVSFTYTPVCTGVEMNFVSAIVLPAATSIEQYNWFLNDIGISNNDNFTHFFTENGNYELKLNVQIDNGCSANYTEIISVANEYPVPEYLSLISPNDGCNLNSDNTNVDFSWNTSSNTNYYKFQLSQDIEFTNILSEIITEENNINLDINYNFDTMFWRIISYNPCLETINSEARIITKFNPSDITNTALWLRADSVQIIDNKVARWYDLSNNNYEIIQETAENRPVFLDSSLNNQPIIKFDGVNDYLDGGNILNFGTESHTSYFIFKASKGTIISKARYAVTPSRYGLFFEAGVFNDFYYDNANRIGIITPFNKTVYNFANLINSRSANKNQTYINSVLIAEQVINGLYDMSSTDLYLIGALCNSTGSIPPQANFYTDASIAEIIIFDKILNDLEQSNIRNYLQNKYSPPVNLGYDIHIRSGFCDTAIATAYKPWFTAYEWSTGETDSIIHVNRPGLYSVTVTDIFGFESSDDIRVFYPDIIDFSDTILCLGDTLKYEYPRDLPYTFLWSNGDTSRYFESSEAGIHSLTVTDNLGCSYQTYFHLQLDSLSAKMSLGDDRSMCSGEELSPSFGDLPTQDLSYLWMNGSTESSLILQNTHEFSLQVSNERGCVAYDTVQITLQGIKPIAAFDAVGVCFGNETPFTDASSSPDGSNIIAWEWDFGDSLFANAQNPSHTYLESGIYRVKLSILTENLCAAETQLQIAVYSLPKAHFSPLTACAKAPLSFVDQSISEYQINHWNWSFNDSNSSTPNSNLQNPIHIFDTAGVYHVELIVNHVFGCSDTLTQIIEIRPGAMADFHANTACKGSPTWFNSSTEVDSWNPIVSYFWEFLPVFRDSLPVSSFRFDTAGVYPVKHRIKLLNGCQSEITKNVKVAPLPQAHFDNPESCLNTPYFITDQSSIPSDSIVSVSWFINNQFYASSHQIEINFPQADTFQIKQIVTSNENCRDTLILPVIIHPVPNANFSMEYDDQSIGNRIVFSNSSTEAQSYYWDFDNGSVSTQYSPIMDFPLEGSYTISLVATNEHSCSDTTSKTISIANPNMDLHLMEADFVHQDNYVNTNIRFANLGNRPVFSLWIDSKINDKTGREKWIGILRPGEIVDYTLHSTTYLPSYKAIDYACISISNDDYPIERNYENNSICISKSEEFALYELFPNPAQDKITLMLNAPSKNQSEIHIYHPDGRNAQNPIQESLKKGINQIQLPIQNLEPGVYLVQIRFEEKMISRKFVVLRK